jgi:CobQ-like glutamine amidotransferase family enzyme
MHPSNSSALTVVAVYPSVLGTYGDAGNADVLVARAQQHGFSVRLKVIDAFAPVPASGDIYLLGGSDDAAQTGAVSALRQHGGLGRAIEAGAAVFAVCAGFQLLGESFPAGDRQVPGLGLLDANSHRLPTRAVGELLTRPADGARLTELTGYENHASGTTLGPAARPLASVELGIGNGDGADGARQGRITATYLHGPAFARNIGLVDHVLEQVVGRLAELPYPPYAHRLRTERIDAARSRADRPRGSLQELFEQISHRARRRRGAGH